MPLDQPQKKPRLGKLAKRSVLLQRGHDGTYAVIRSESPASRKNKPRKQAPFVKTIVHINITTQGEHVVRQEKPKPDIQAKPPKKPSPLYIKQASYRHCDAQGNIRAADRDGDHLPIACGKPAGKKKKNLKKQAWSKEARVLAKATQLFLDDYKIRAKRSKRKKRDGAREDFWKNAFWASKKASMLLRKSSRIYNNRSDFTKQLHAEAIKYQQKTLGK
ncbi:hypothetical protein [Methylogaea oryzae]|uniref:Uncharacterized protein n=1 Tax=Methylogaea oryzae TaxID=1295382 RepID=A0A8D4VRN8_9GAMM|nr:hypothetical protein [Methylogaea oryzae]BBL71314.1 hypothetical protein MoryE10_19200 [Methylogaea oryzae]